MGMTPDYSLRYPELADPPNGPGALGTLAADVDAALNVARDAALAGLVATPTPAAGWDWLESYGAGVAIKHGFVVTVSGMLKRTGATFTPQRSPATTYPVLVLPWTSHVSLSQTGVTFLGNASASVQDHGVIRWYIAMGTTSLQILNPGYDMKPIATGNAVSVCLTYVAGRPGGVVLP